MRVAAAFYEMVLGAALLFAPWSPLWQENWLVWRTGILQPLLSSGPLRGAISGIGAAFLLSAIEDMNGAIDAARGARARTLAEEPPTVPPGRRGL